MEPTDRFDPPLDFKVKGLVPVVRFGTPQEISDWFGTERGVWRALQKQYGTTVPDDQALNEGYADFQKVLNSVQNELTQLIERRAEQSSFSAPLKTYAKHLQNRNLIYSGSPAGIAVKRIAEKDPQQAARVLLNLRQAALPTLRQTSWGTMWGRAAAVAEAIERGWLDNPETVETGLTAFIRVWDERFADKEQSQAANADQQQELLRALKSSSEEFEQALQQCRSQADETVMRLNAEANGAMSTLNADITALKNTYNAELALQAPTSYWRAKQIGHRWVAGAWGATFVALMLGAIGVGLLLWERTIQPYFTPTAPPAYGYFFPIVAFGFLAVWLLRIVSKQLMAHFALASDAGERVAMVKTFLALMQKPDHVREPDRLLILSSLFRPALRSEDDAAPPNWFDLLMERVKPK